MTYDRLPAAEAARCDLRTVTTAARYGRVYETDQGIKVVTRSAGGLMTTFTRTRWGRAAEAAGFIVRESNWSFRATELGIAEFGLLPYVVEGDADA